MILEKEYIVIVACPHCDREWAGREAEDILLGGHDNITCDSCDKVFLIDNNVGIVEK